MKEKIDNFRGVFMRVLLIICFFAMSLLGIVVLIITIPIWLIQGLITNKFPKWAIYLFKPLNDLL